MKQLAFPGRAKFKIKEFPTEITPLYRSDAEYEKLILKLSTELAELQEILFAQGQHALLIVLQGMDTSGKDGIIRHVFSRMNPQGCDVHSFKQPTQQELGHDYLWRASQNLPERGMIGVFNRSYYEDVVTVRIHPEFLERQRLPKKLIRNPRKIWKQRFQEIIDFEAYLVDNAIYPVKFFLHISKNEQRKRLIDRINRKDKNWKFSFGDINERQLWSQYRAAYESCLRHTATARAPWYVIPADDKKNARLLVGNILLQRLKALKLAYPVPSSTETAALQKLRKLLANHTV